VPWSQALAFGKASSLFSFFGQFLASFCPLCGKFCGNFWPVLVSYLAVFTQSLQVFGQIVRKRGRVFRQLFRVVRQLGHLNNNYTTVAIRIGYVLRLVSTKHEFPI
jgi:hypothetical protein